MPVQVSYPGVYVQEVSSGVRTITGVSTSIAAFFGRANKGPINQATRILSLTDYERKFGSAFSKGRLTESIQQFFSNGGTDCYVVRLAHNASKATLTLNSLNSAQATLVLSAKAEGLWANTLRAEVDYDTPTPESSFNLTLIQEEDGSVVGTESFTNLNMDSSSARFAPNFITQSSNLVDVALDASLGDTADAASDYNSDTFDGFSGSRRAISGNVATLAGVFNTDLFGNGMTSFNISVNGGAPLTVDLSTDGNLPTSSFNDIASEIESRINNVLATQSPAQQVTCAFQNVTGIGRFLSITAATPLTTNTSVAITRASTNDIAQALMLGVDQGGIEPNRFSNFRPAPSASLLSYGNPAATNANDYISSLNTIAALQQTSLTSMDINGETIDFVGDYDLETSAGRWVSNAVGASTITDDSDGVREKLRIMADAINANSALTVQAQVWGYQLALIETDGSINNTPTVSTTAAAFGNEMQVNVRQYTLGTGGTGAFSSGTDGDDGTAPQYADFIGSEAQQTGFHSLDPVDLFNLMIIPEDEEIDEATMLSLWGPASTYCANNRAFLIIDPPASWTNSSGRPAVVSDTAMINDLRISTVKDHSAIYYPRIKYNDNGVIKAMGASGAVAGLMARTDASRGVFKAPAGVEAGLRNLSGVNVELTDAENGVLNKKGVNCIRVFPNGLVSWGARTLDGDDDFGSEWKYVPVRRLALMIEESLFRGTKWVVFEPNDEPLWAKIRMNINAFMTSLFRQGAFQGTTAKEAFFVKCDSETTTQDDINKGIVNIKVGFAPLKPAEFVVITIQQMAGEL